MTDWQLLRKYIEQGSDDAFAELVARHVDMVYAAARRQVRDSHLAEDVTQGVFILLSRRARNLKSSVILPGWLYQAARLSASAALRGERRRKYHEKMAAEVIQMRSEAGDPASVWAQIEPMLDEAMGRLNQRDRDAIVLRFLEGRSMAQTGDAIGVSEQAAKMRVHRAVGRLRFHLGNAGDGIPGSLFTTAMALARDSHPAPPALGAAAASAASTLGAATAKSLTIAKGANTIMIWTKIKMTAAAAISIVLIGTGAIVLAQSVLTRSSQAIPIIASNNPNATTAPSSNPLAIHVSVTYRQISVENKPSDWEALRKTIDAIPPEHRQKMRLELSAVSGDLPVSAYFDAQDRASEIVKATGLAYLSNTGIQQPAGDSQLKGEYYVGGNTRRNGVYSLADRKVTLMQALIAAGLDEAGMNDQVDLIRRVDGGEKFTRGISVSELFDGTRADIYLLPYDQIMVRAPK